MSKQIDRLIAELVEDSMADISKLKKDELRSLVKGLIIDNLRELSNDTIIDLYEERYNTVLVKS
jgi:hypothetical protein